MGGRTIFACAFALCAACGDKGTDGAAAKAGGAGGVPSAAGQAGAVAGDDGPRLGDRDRHVVAGAAAEEKGGMAELFTGDFYRADGGRMVVTLGTPPKGWRARREGKGSMVKIELAHQSQPASIQIVIPATQGAEVDPKAAAMQVARDFAASRPGAKVIGGREMPHDGGKAFGVSMSIPAAEGRPELIGGFMAVADGRDVVFVISQAPAPMYDSADLAPLLEQLHGSLKVGSRVPTLAAGDPGTPLSGTFIYTGKKLNQFWALVFDPRGVFHDDLKTTLDMEGYLQRGAKLGRYEVSGDKVELQLDGREPRSLELVEGGRGIREGDATYWRADGHTDGWTLDGKWAATTFYSSAGVYDTFSYSAAQRYYFTAKGTFSHTSFAAASTTGNEGIHPSARPASDVYAYLDEKPDAGRYVIEGDRLRLMGTRSAVELTFFPLMTRSGKVSRDVLYIDGRFYLKED